MEEGLDAPGALQMGILKKTLMGRNEWWYLVPDQTVFAAGGKTDGKVLEPGGAAQGRPLDHGVSGDQGLCLY